MGESQYTRWKAGLDLGREVERGKAFSASDRFTVADGATVYIHPVIPEGTQMRLYDRIVTTGGDPFNVDVVKADSFDTGQIEFAHTDLNCRTANVPNTRFYRGASNLQGEEVREYGRIPAERGPQSGGAIAADGAYRLLCADSPLLLRLENTGNTTRTVTVLFVFVEEMV